MLRLARPPAMYQCIWLVHIAINDSFECFFDVFCSGYSIKTKGVDNLLGIANQRTWLIDLTTNDPPEYFFDVFLSGYSTKTSKRKMNAITISKQAVDIKWEKMIQESRYRTLPSERYYCPIMGQ